MNLAAIAFLASALVPAQPTSFEPVTLRWVVDSCAFVPSTVRVTMSSNVIHVGNIPNYCFAAGTPQVVDVLLGAFPAGDYVVDFQLNFNAGGGLCCQAEEIKFQVRDPAQIAVFPPPAHPLTDYTGVWYNPQESGWGLSLFQGATYNVFGLLFVYDSANRPAWYSLQGAKWTDSRTLTGTLIRTTGPAYGGAFNASQVSYEQAGTAKIDFTQPPGQEGRARLTYTIGNTSVTTPIMRISM